MTRSKHSDSSRPSVIHCFRTPVGGVFRHVRDLAAGQASAGYRVGIICDSDTGGQHADAVLKELERDCELGVYRLPMQRLPHPSDFAVQRRVNSLVKRLQPNVVHGHGAKGGAYTRMLPARLGARTVYTPHGGVLHYDPGSFVGKAFFNMERFLQRRTDAMIFVSHFGKKKYAEKIGSPACLQQVIHNGLGADEFAAIKPSGKRFDFVFVGELRMLKGIATLLEAFSAVRQTHDASLLLVGDGPDADEFDRLIVDLDLQDAVTRVPSIFPVRKAFEMARCMVVPSHAESLPYIVLEIAAASVPLIATNVGGIPEILGAENSRLVPPDKPDCLARALHGFLENPSGASADADALARRVQADFQMESMISATDAVYRKIQTQRPSAYGLRASKSL